MFLRHAITVILFTCTSLFAYSQTVEQHLQDLYLELPDSLRQSAHIFASRKAAPSNPVKGPTSIETVQEFIHAVTQLSPRDKEQLLHYVQKRHSAWIANKGGTTVYEETEELRRKGFPPKGKKSKIPDPF